MTAYSRTDVPEALPQYLRTVHALPMLTIEEEGDLARRFRDYDDHLALERMITSHLRLVTRIAGRYRGYGLPLGEIIAEGNIGLIQAAKRFDPERGFRLATYSIWWIRASIQEYILRSWSLVKIGTTAAQKKLFFNLRKIKHRLSCMESGDLSVAMVGTIADQLSVPHQEVINMDRRLSGPDRSLNVPSPDVAALDWQDSLPDETQNQEVTLSRREVRRVFHDLLRRSLADLAPRERAILIQRRLREQPTTLEALSRRYDISRERVRQIEARALEKLRSRMIADEEAFDLVGPHNILTRPASPMESAAL